MAAKDTSKDLPDWAQTLWTQAGSPDLSDSADTIDGPLLDRRHGLRRDDLLEILLDPRAVTNGEEPVRRGRLLSPHKATLEIIGADGRTRFVTRDAIVELVIVAHLRPPYLDDEELHQFEREEGRRRASLHETAQQKADDGGQHAWG